MTTSQRDQWLRGAVLAGDEAAWRALYEENYEPLQRYVRWRCGGREDWAAEICQDVWLTAVRRIADFDPARGALLDWLRGIAALQLRNNRRRMMRRETSPLDASNEPAASVEPSGDLSLVDALAEISDRHEAVLRAKYLDGWSVREIACRWNETPKAIESLLTRARQAFREVYERMLRVD